MSEAVTSGATATIEASNPARFYQHGWHSWCDTSWVDPALPRRIVADERDRLGHDDPVHALDQVPGGAGVGAVEHGDGSVTLLGALAGGAWVTYDAGTLVGRYEAGSGPWVTLSGPEPRVFSRYAELLAGHLGRRGGDRMRLWCSWYSAYEDISEALMHETIAAFGELEFDVIQVDDGWQRAIGDWEPNEKFGAGMGEMARRIQDTGRRAGLWLAPFIARTDSQLARRRPELFLQEPSGEPVVAGINWGGPYWALDMTNEAAIEFVEDTMTRYRDLGYSFFKLDFIYGAAFPGHHANPMPRAAAYRTACQRIRTAVGEDAYLLGCGAPVVESIGVFDGLRIGPDVGAVWADGTYAAARRAITTTMHRLWLRPAIDPDPDVVYFRETELRPGTITILRRMAQVAGFLGTSDLPQNLDPVERASLASFLTSTPSIEQIGRYRWLVDGELLDVEPALTAGDAEPDWQAVS